MAFVQDRTEVGCDRQIALPFYKLTLTGSEKLATLTGSEKLATLLYGINSYVTPAGISFGSKRTFLVCWLGQSTDGSVSLESRLTGNDLDAHRIVKKIAQKGLLWCRRTTADFVAVSLYRLILQSAPCSKLLVFQPA